VFHGTQSWTLPWSEIAAPNHTAGWNSTDQTCVQSFSDWNSASALWRSSLPPEPPGVWYEDVLFIPLSDYNAATFMHSVTSTTFETQQFLSSQGLGNGSVYTTCDGIPRFRFHSQPTSQTLMVVTVTREVLQTYYPFHEDFPPGFKEKFSSSSTKFPSPSPDCGIDSNHCSEFRSSYRAQRTKSGLDDWDYYKPGDRESGGPCMLESPSIAGCYMEAGSEVVLLYWPPVLISRDVCGADGLGTALTVSSPASGPSLVVTTSAITFGGVGIRGIDAQAWLDSGTYDGMLLFSPSAKQVC
jgi:hypothetical protein